MAIRGQSAEPRINRTFPIALRPGTVTEITFFGEHLANLPAVWTSFPATAERIKSTASEAIFKISVETNVPVQLGGIRLVGTNSLSNLHLMLVDDLPTLRKESSRKETPQAILPGVAIEGAVEELAADFFSFPARKGQEFSIDILAHRLGSALDPLLRVLDFSGKELVYSLQATEPNGDPRIRFVAPASGKYTIELRDVGYRGGANHFYRLRFGGFPIITAPYPPVIEQGSQPHLILLGPSVNGIPAPVLGPFSSAANLVHFIPLAAKASGGFGSGFAQLGISDSPQFIEREPNDKPTEAAKITLPIGLNGRFERRGDQDFYEFEAAKGDRLVFEGSTRRLGSACDLSMRLTDSTGHDIAESNNTSSQDGFLEYTLESAGTYRLIVQELTGASAPDFVYHIDAKRQAGGFELIADSDRAEPSTNGAVTVSLSCHRDHYDGPIMLSVRGLESCRLGNAVIPEKKTNTQLRIFVDSLPLSRLAVQVIGEATIHGKSFKVRAGTIPALHKTWPMMVYPPEQFNDWIWITPTRLREE